MTEELASQVVSRLLQRREQLATAESLTGGLIGMLLTDVPGSSEVYLGGVISYATRLKATLAGVSSATLASLGPVAAETAAEMASGVLQRCSADWGLAVTGVAGPEPQDGHPVGQVFVAIAGTDGPITTELSLTGDRGEIRTGTAQQALRLLLDALG